jgi:tetratricopeptide (TPR) repeat protein
LTIVTAIISAGLIAHDRVLKADLAKAKAETRRAIAELDLFLRGKTAKVNVDQILGKLMPLIQNESSDAQAKQVFRAGWEQSGLGRHPEAILLFDKAIEMGYVDYQVYYWRGRSHAFLDEDQKAVKDFDDAIARNPNFVRSYWSRALALASSANHRVRDCDKAVLDIDKAFELRPPDDDDDAKYSYFTLAQACGAASRGPCKVPAETLLERGEQFLLRAMDLGYTPGAILRVHELDRFKMLKPILSRPNVQERMKRDAKE